MSSDICWNDTYFRDLNRIKKQQFKFFSMLICKQKKYRKKYMCPLKLRF